MHVSGGVFYSAFSACFAGLLAAQVPRIICFFQFVPYCNVTTLLPLPPNRTLQISSDDCVRVQPVALHGQLLHHHITQVGFQTLCACNDRSQCNKLALLDFRSDDQFSTDCSTETANSQHALCQLTHRQSGKSAEYFYTIPADTPCTATSGAASSIGRCVNTEDAWCQIRVPTDAFPSDRSLRLCSCSGPLKHAMLSPSFSSPCDQSSQSRDLGTLTLHLSARRRLQSATPRPAQVQPIAAAPVNHFQALPVHTACETQADCSDFENCIDGACAGFEADVADAKLIRCVDGYRCDITQQLPGKGITQDFQVIGVSPSERCGAAQPLPAKLSIFANSNRWRCGTGNYCSFSPGVGIRRNKTLTLEGLRLCGCPASDLDKNGIPCDDEKDFYVPLAKLGVQECLTNAHCLHKTFAYCVNDHCAGFMGFAGSAGMKAYQCLLNKSCTIQSLASKALNEGLKVIPIAASFSCGAEQALDPSYFEDAALPCVMDINGDGECDVHLGVARALGTNRLCGCSGKDIGGNGRACDEPADFDSDLGILSVHECVVDVDCTRGVCIDSKCFLDTQSPYVVSIQPPNGTSVVPPVAEIRLTFNENVRYTKSGNRRFVLTTPNSQIKFEIPIADPTMSTSTGDAYRVDIEGRDLIVKPDIRMSSLPEGPYLLAFEGGIVEDLQGNGNLGATNFTFQVSANAGCAFLGVTGFTVDNVNLNGIYRASSPLNNKPKWTALGTGQNELAVANTIFWRAATPKLEGRWVIGLNYDESKFLAFADVPMEVADTKPPSGRWKRWKSGQWKDQGDVIISCPEARLTSAPKVVTTSPLPGDRGVDPHDFQLEFHFDRPVTFGHWAFITIKALDGSQEIIIDPEDPATRNNILVRDLEKFRMILKSPEDLKAGTKYSVSVETGTFTDLQYNPSPPISPQDFTFTSFGAPCARYPVETGGHIEILGDEESWEHLDEMEIRCWDSYSPRIKQSDQNKFSDRITWGTTYPKQTPTVVSVLCYDGEWEMINLNCRADCRQYQAMGNQYDVTVVNAVTDDALLPMNWDLQSALDYNFMKDGSEVRISCVATSDAESGSPLGEISVCQNGRWTDVALRCGATCGAFPSLGPAYKILSGVGVKLGMTRSIACNSDAVGDLGAQETLSCLETGWEKPTISCHYDCPSLDVESFYLEGGLIPLTPLTANMTSHGSAFIFTCAPNTLARFEGESEWSQSEQTFWDMINRTVSIDPADDTKVAIACYEGAWRKAKPLSCQHSCPPFEPPGVGYTYELLAGDGTAPGSTYSISCKGDAVAQHRGAGVSVDTVVCLKGQWSRLTTNVLCYGACPHPTVYFGASYQLSDDSGRIVALPTQSATGLTFKHHSRPFKLECAPGMQPLNAPHSSDPYLIQTTTQPKTKLDLSKVHAVPTLFEHPSQLVACDDGYWMPATSEVTAGDVDWDISGLLRCVPFCPSLNLPSSERFSWDDLPAGTGWGHQRTLSCKQGYKGALIRRSPYGELQVTEKPSVTLSCYHGVWTAPMPAVSAPGIPVAVSVTGDRQIIKGRSSTDADFRQALVVALPCGSPCSRRDLEAQLTTQRLRLTKPNNRNKVPKHAEHGFFVEVACDKGQTRLSGPLSDKMVCADGEWSTPILFCGRASCEDGVQNNGEAGVDCGGTCSRSCSAHKCETAGACRTCPTLPSDSSYIYTQESMGAAGRLLKAQDFPLAHKSVLHAHWNESFFFPMELVVQRPYLSLECVDGDWNLPEGNRSLTLARQVVNCADNRMRRGEWGVDCGGVCEAACPDCEDGVQNGQETWVDCGGNVCAPCRDCSNTDFKQFTDTDKYIITVVTAPLSVSSQHNPPYDPAHVVAVKSQKWSTASVAQGALRRIQCAANAEPVMGSAPLDLICLDGRWWPQKLAVSLINGVESASAYAAVPTFALRCEKKDVLQIQNRAFHSFRPLPQALSLDICDSNLTTTDEMSNEAHFCCDLVTAFVNELSGECGALLYGGAGKVDSFCRGVCINRLLQVTDFYDRRRDEINSLSAAKMTRAQAAHFGVCQNVARSLQKIASLLCVRNAAERTERETTLLSTSPIAQVNSDYCFSQASLHLRHIRNFDVLLKKEELDIACKSDSCFRTNLEYFSVLWDLLSTQHFTISSTKARRLEGVEDPLLHHIFSFQSAVESHAFAHQRALTSLAAFLEGGDEEDQTCPLEGCPSRRRLSYVEPLISNPNDLKFSPSVAQLMCLVDNRGKPCATQLRQLMQGVTRWGNEGGGSQTDMGMAMASLSAACSNGCFLQITRYLGQHLSTQGTESADPFQRFFGVLLKMYGRYFCQRDSSGASCGVKYFGHLLQGFRATPSLLSPVSPSPDLIQALPICDAAKCPPAYISDGLCDSSCFNEACGYDGRDCFVPSMFTNIFERLSAPLPLSDPCHPLNPALNSCRKHSTCYNKLRDVLLREGCCFAVGVDILQELLDLELFSHPLLRDQTRDPFVGQLRALIFPTESSLVFPQSGKFSLDFYDTYRPDRSSVYAQALCNLFVDRSCSRGLARRVIELEFSVSQLPYDAIYWFMPTHMRPAVAVAQFPPNVDYPDFQMASASISPYLRFTLILRKHLSDIFALPIADIRDLKVWPNTTTGGTDITMTVDTGLVVEELQRSMASAIATGELTKSLGEALSLWRSGLTGPLADFINAVSEAPATARRLDVEDDSSELNFAAIAISLVPDTNSTRHPEAVPTMTVSNLQINMRALDPIRAPSSISANYSGGDPLEPTDGTFDLGEFKAIKASCDPRILIAATEENQAVAFTSFSLSKSISGIDGDTLELSCPEGFSPPVEFPEDLTSQSVICMNGRWVAQNRQPLLKCAKPCSEFSLGANVGLLQVAGTGQVHGAQRTVTCTTGYQSVSGVASQTVTCRDGLWDEISIQCQRAPLFDGSCAGVPLDLMASEFKYKMSTEKKTTNLVWWKASCQRGYERDVGTDPLHFVCLDDSVLYAFASPPRNILQMLTKKSTTNEMIELAMRQFVADGKENGQVGVVEMARLMWTSSLPLRANTLLSEDVRLQCSEAILIEPELLVSTGIDDTMYIIVVAAVAFGVTGAFAAWGYYWQVKGRQRRLIKHAKKAAAVARSADPPLLQKPENVGLFPSTQATDVANDKSKPAFPIETEEEEEEQPLYHTLPQDTRPRLEEPAAAARNNINYLAAKWRQSGRRPTDSASSQSFYSDLELFAHQRQSQASSEMPRQTRSNRPPPSP